MKDAEIGIQYLAFGYSFLVQATYSALSLKKKYDWPVSIITNVPFKNEQLTIDGITPFDDVRFIQNSDNSNRLYKTSLPKYTPFQKTIFLDCDTEVVGDLTPAIALLDRYELLARLHSWPVEYKDPKGCLLKLPFKTKDYPHWNSGVLLYKKGEQVDNFFETWNRRFVEIGYHMDQPSFAETIINSKDLAFQSLDMSWNCWSNFSKIHKNLEKNLRVDHFRISYSTLLREKKLSNQMISCKAIEPSQVTEHFKKRHSLMRFSAKKILKAI